MIPDAEIAPFVESCTAVIGGGWEGDFETGGYEVDRCGAPAVDDSDEPRCERHLDG